jgi:hypothetical protein
MKRKQKESEGYTTPPRRRVQGGKCLKMTLRKGPVSDSFWLDSLYSRIEENSASVFSVPVENKSRNIIYPKKTSMCYL